MILLHLESEPNLGPRRVIRYSPIKSLGFSFQPIRIGDPTQTAIAVAYERGYTLRVFFI